MTAAMVRTCNSCKKPFLKDGGCNRMYCSCGNSQCFICSTTVTAYTHFSPTTCPLYDDTDERIRIAVTEAQGQAVKKALQVRKDVTIDDIAVDKALLAEQTNDEVLNPHEVEDDEDDLDVAVREDDGDWGLPLPGAYPVEQRNDGVLIPHEGDDEDDLEDAVWEDDGDWGPWPGAYPAGPDGPLGAVIGRPAGNAAVRPERTEQDERELQAFLDEMAMRREEQQRAEREREERERLERERVERERREEEQRRREQEEIERRERERLERERQERERQAELERQRETAEREQREREEREAQAALERERQEAEEVIAAIAAVEEFQTKERLELEAELQAEAERQRKQQIQEQRTAERRRERERLAAIEQARWDTFLEKSQVLHRSIAERPIAPTASAEEAEVYLATKLQTIYAFIAEAKQLVAENQRKIKQKGVSVEVKARNQQAKAALRWAEREAARRRKEGAIRRKEAKEGAKRQKKDTAKPENQPRLKSRILFWKK